MINNEMGPHFITSIQGIKIHFIHRNNNTKERRPALLLVHGWPCSFLIFRKVLSKLQKHFDLIVPSIPGYGFSEPAKTLGMHCANVAKIFHELIVSRLGYETYYAQGGDWGSIIVQCMARLFPECAAIHITMPIPVSSNFDVSDLKKLKPFEIAAMKKTKQFRDLGSGYQDIQKTRPQSLSFGLSDSPVGLASWILEKFKEWSDCNGDLESVFTKDELITNIMLYWITNSIGSSIRLYYETLAVMPNTDKETLKLMQTQVNIPTAIAMFPHEIYQLPRVLCKRTYVNLQRYVRYKSGGHFAPIECPDVFARDIIDFFVEMDSMRSKL
jgi:pimeloyl-ACP methyl ester carboxylesterase